MSVKDDLAGVLADSLNKKFKDYKVAYFLDGTDNTPTDVKEFVSTGSTMLDLAISNRPNGGIAVGRITELNGLESSGKSLIGAHLLAETQKKGGVAVYIDTETAVSEDFLGVIGVDINKMLYLHLETVEDIFEAIEEIVTKVRESDKDRLVTILVDSLAAATTKVELNADYDKDGDPYTTSGGKALPFHASTRIRLKNKGQIKDSKKNVIGMTILAQVIKNRLGPPLRKAEFPLYFESGIDDEGSWLQVLKEHNLAKVGGAWYTMKDHNGEEIKFQSKDWAEKLEDEEFKSYCYQLICDKIILKYNKAEIGIDDVEITDEVIGE